MPQISGYVKTFKAKDGDKDKTNKLMSFRIDNEKLLQKYKDIWTKIEDLKSIELNALLVYDDRYIKTKIRTYGDKVYTIFHGLNVPDSLFAYRSKYHLQVYLENCAYKIASKQMADYFDGNLFED